MPAAVNCCTSSCPDTELVQVPGIQGINGVAGSDGTDGTNCYTFLNGDLPNVAALGSQVSATVLDNTGFVVGQTVFIADAVGLGTDHGTFRVISKTGTTAMLVEFLYAGGDTAPAFIILSTGTVTATGSPGGGRAAAGDPEGVLIGSPGDTYLNTTDESFWVKKTGTASNTLWIKIVGMFIILGFVTSLVARPPILRQTLTTNTEPAALGIVTNISAFQVTNYVTTVGMTTNLTVVLTGTMKTNMLYFSYGILTNVIPQP